MGDRTTLELLDAWHGGDKQALVGLIERHVPWLRSYVRRRMTTKMRLFEGSEDVVQSVLYNLLRYTPPFRPQDERQFRALIARAVYNRFCELHDYVTAQVRDPERAEPMPSAPSRIGIATSASSNPVRKLTKLEEEREALQERGFLALALQLIDPEDRRVVQLHDFQHKGFQEIGEALAITEDGARSKHRRALQRLRRQVDRLKRGQIEDLMRELDEPASGPVPGGPRVSGG